MYEENEVSKHRKKSNKSVAKSKHKHQYKECLLQSPNDMIYFANYCIICGKVNNISLFPSKSIGTGRYQVLNRREILETYKHLEVKKLENIFKDKFVDVGEE